MPRQTRLVPPPAFNEHLGLLQRVEDLTIKKLVRAWRLRIGVRRLNCEPNGRLADNSRKWSFTRPAPKIGYTMQQNYHRSSVTLESHAFNPPVGKPFTELTQPILKVV